MAHWKGMGLILIACALAVSAGAIVFLYLKGMPAAAAQERGTVPVVVATADITFGTKLGDEHLRLVPFPKDAVPKGAYTSLDSVLQQTTKVFLVTGEPVVASKLSSIGGGLSVLVRESMRASSVDVDEVSGVSGFVLPGDRVDVLVTVDNANGPGVSVTTTILQNLEVLAAGSKTETKDKRASVQSVTLLVTPEGAEALALAMHQGRIHLVLRNPVDHSIVSVKPTDTQSVLGMRKAQAEKPTRKVAPPPTPKPTPPAPTPVPDPGYTIIRDGSIQKQKPPSESPRSSSGGN